VCIQFVRDDHDIRQLQIEIQHAEIFMQNSENNLLKDSPFVDEFAGRIALRPSQLAMFDGGRGGDGIAVFVGKLGPTQTCYQIVNQLRKMSSTLVIAKMKMVEYGGLLCSYQPIFDQRSLTAGQDCGYAHCLPPASFHPRSEHCLRLVL
jgi:hypothetical protein